MVARQTDNRNRVLLGLMAALLLTAAVLSWRSLSNAAAENQPDVQPSPRAADTPPLRFTVGADPAHPSGGGTQTPPDEPPGEPKQPDRPRGPVTGIALAPSS